MNESPAAMFQRILRTSESHARTFEEAGYSTIEEIAYVPLNEFLQLNAPEWVLNEIRERAREYLLIEATRRFEGEDPS
jgi:N utilization substance protein A